MKKVLLIGFRPGLEAAVRDLGYAPVVVTNKVKPGLDSAATLVVRSLESPEEVLSAVLRSYEAREFAGVVTGHEQGVFTASVIRSSLNLPGDTDVARSLVFRDKHLQKEHLGNSVEHAKSIAVTRLATYEGLAEILGSPFVVKPSSGFGSSSVSIVSSEVEFVSAIYDLTSDFQYVAENFISGPECHVDGIWWEGSLVWFSIARYIDSPHKCNDDGIMADYVLTESQNQRLFVEAERLTTRTLRSLDSPSGAFHLEAFITDSGLVLGEVAIRPPGGHVPEIVELTYGTNLFEAHVQASLGISPAVFPRTSTPKSVYGFVYLRRFRGSNLSTEHYRANFPEITHIELANSGITGGAYNRDGFAILRCDSEAALSARMRKVVQMNAGDRG